MLSSASARVLLALLGALGLLASIRGAGDAAEHPTRTDPVRIRIVATTRTEGELAPCG